MEPAPPKSTGKTHFAYRMCAQRQWKLPRCPHERGGYCCMTFRHDRKHAKTDILSPPHTHPRQLLSFREHSPSPLLKTIVATIVICGVPYVCRLQIEDCACAPVAPAIEVPEQRQSGDAKKRVEDVGQVARALRDTPVLCILTAKNEALQLGSVYPVHLTNK